MADLAQIFLQRTKRSAAQGVGDAVASQSIDPVDDALQQLGALQAYFAVLAAGGSPTASQIAAAQSAIGAIGADLRTLQTKAQPPAGSKVWVSAPAVGAVAVGSVIVGGVVGWMAHGARKESK